MSSPPPKQEEFMISLSNKQCREEAKDEIMLF